MVGVIHGGWRNSRLPSVPGLILVALLHIVLIMGLVRGLQTAPPEAAPKPLQTLVLPDTVLPLPPPPPLPPPLAATELPALNLAPPVVPDIVVPPPAHSAAPAPAPAASVGQAHGAAGSPAAGVVPVVLTAPERTGGRAAPDYPAEYEGRAARVRGGLHHRHGRHAAALPRAGLHRRAGIFARSAALAQWTGSSGLRAGTAQWRAGARGA